MSAEERKQILQMVADGKISAEEAAKLMRVLDDSAAEEVEIIQPDSARPQESSADDPSWSKKPEAPEFEEVRRRAYRFSSAFLWIGIFITVIFAWWMFSIQQSAGLNFWFFCLSMPFLFGVLLIALGAGANNSRWLYVNVDRSNAKDGDGPKHISIAFPLPLGLAAWFLRVFGSHIENLKDKNVDEIINFISMTKDIKEPLIVNVDESDKGGERVQVFIG